MKRGELYRVPHPSKSDPKKSRVFVVVSRQAVIESRFSTVVCAPVYSAYHGLPSQLEVGVEEGLKHTSSVHCDELISLPKLVLTDFVGSLSDSKLEQLNRALAAALDSQVRLRKER
ncbi:MAG TPA: type II toxin-antitoxin system PemK/MazF family toxin [Thermoanaerobaculia bacterium]|nr:type II toxin-antitoxin system PemK/MazF family toxin [Thermoanaerobaculia bacterium]